MDALWEKFLTLYGPLGLGWLLSGYLLWELRSSRKKLEEVLEKSTSAMVALTTFVQARLPGGGG